jgi:light-regulated signal transduction histidine kinase (bacteriophytochrome)
MNNEIDSLRRALEAETERCLELQRRLDRANQSFADFVCSAAHDMREYLRQVDSFSQLIAESYNGDLESDTGVYLRHLRQGVTDLQSLFGGMVDYWSMGVGSPQRSPIDMEGLVNHALLHSEQQISDRNALVTHDSLPVVMGDFQVLTKVLHHLIRNGIEYSGAAVPRVHISSNKKGTEWVFSVTDNGPGIDPEFQDRLFHVFKRLHGKEYPGNGLGLAFCKKSIEWMGGRVWLETTPGAGSTFCFSVAAAE